MQPPFSSSAAAQPSRVVSAIATRQLEFNSPFSLRLPLSQPSLYLLSRPSSRSSRVLGPLLSTTADHKSLEGRREILDAIVFSRTDVVVHGPVTGAKHCGVAFSTSPDRRRSTPWVLEGYVANCILLQIST